MSGVLARGSKHYERLSTVAKHFFGHTDPWPLECEGVEARLEGICQYLEN